MRKPILLYILLVVLPALSAFALGTILARRSHSRALRPLLEAQSKRADSLQKLDEFTVLDERGPAQFCRVHNTRLSLDLVPVSYGLPFADPIPYDVRRNHFPYANTKSQGGCVLRAWQEALVLYCPACREAETEWKNAQAGEKKLERQNSKPQPAHSAD